MNPLPPDNKHIRLIITLIVFTILIFTLFQNVNLVLSGIKYLIALVSPLIAGLCVAFILNIPMKFIEEKPLKFLSKSKYKLARASKRPISLILTYLLIIGILILILLLVVPEFKNTVTLIKNNFPAYISSVRTWINTTLEKFNIDASSFSNIQINWDTISKTVIDFLTKGSGGALANGVVGFTSSLANGMVNSVLSLIFSIYILAQKEFLGKQLKKVAGAFISVKFLDKSLEIVKLTSETFANFISGQVIEACILGTLSFIGMIIMRMPYALMISVLISVTALIPVVGAFLGIAVGGFLILMISPIKAMWFIIFIIILQQFEGNVIYPKVVGSSVGLSGLWVLVAVLIGGNVGGAIGMLVSVPVCSVLSVLFNRFVDKKIGDKNITE